MASSNMHTLFAYGDSVKNLTGIKGDEVVTEQCLLAVPKFSRIYFNANNVITKFEK